MKIKPASEDVWQLNVSSAKPKRNVIYYVNSVGVLFLCAEVRSEPSLTYEQESI